MSFELDPPPRYDDIYFEALARMTPNEELDAYELQDLLNEVGVGSIIVWPHEEVVSMDPTSITVLDKRTDTLITKTV